MRIGFLGDGIWAHKALEEIEKSNNLDIAFISARFKNPDPWLKDKAAQLKLPFELFEDINSQESIGRIKAFNCDILVSMSFEQIFRKSILETPPLGVINCHASALPFYRGRNPINWAIINDESELGITVHHVDEGIDTGDIIVQNFIPIKDEDTYGSMLSKAHVACGHALAEALKSIESGVAKRIKQSTIHPIGFYCGCRTLGDEVLNWSWNSRYIYNFVRALAVPGPCARTTIKKTGDEIAIIECEEIEGAPSYIATNGEVVGKNERGVVIKTADKTILVTKIARICGGGLLESETSVPKFRIGTRFK